MKTHPYGHFIEWTASTYIQERRHAAKPTQVTLAWLRAYGITAGRVDAFLRQRLEGTATMPNSLVLDILELGNSKVRETVEDEYVLDALLHTWSGLAEVYGRAATQAEREMGRLELLVEAGHALIMAQGMRFPGGGRLLKLYWQESEMLDLTRIERGARGFKHVAMAVEVIKSQRRALPKKPAGVSAVRRPAMTEGVRQQITPKPTSTATPAAAYDEDRLPSLPISGRHWADPSVNQAYGLYGNWRDRWDNTLP